MLKINLDIFNIDLDEKTSSQGKLDENFVKGIRILNADLITINIGLNIMDIFHPKEGLEVRDTYKSK